MDIINVSAGSDGFIYVDVGEVEDPELQSTNTQDFYSVVNTQTPTETASLPSTEVSAPSTGPYIFKYK